MESSMEHESRDVTQVLLALESNDLATPDALSRIFQITYGELRRIAQRMMSKERKGHTLQPTALVHEAYARLVDQTRVGVQSRAHFFGIAARAMRQVLVDHARKRSATKRGGGRKRVSLTRVAETGFDLDEDVLVLNEALAKLSSVDERMARVVELRVFSGLTMKEVAEVIGVSKRTADNDWSVAVRWLGRELSEGRRLGS